MRARRSSRKGCCVRAACGAYCGRCRPCIWRRFCRLLRSFPCARAVSSPAASPAQPSLAAAPAGMPTGKTATACCRITCTITSPRACVQARRAQYAQTAPREGARRLRAHAPHPRLLLLLRAQDYEKKKAPVGRVVLCAYYCTRAAADASLYGDAVRPSHAPRAPQSQRGALAAATACRRPPPPPLPLCAGV